jgi:hypothetical protein
VPLVRIEYNEFNFIYTKMKKYKTIKIENEMKQLAKLQLEVEKLPPLSDVEKAKFEQALAIDQLYYSSLLEGSDLTKKMIDAAIYKFR